MSLLNVNKIKPYDDGTTVTIEAADVFVSGTLEVSGTIKAFALETITTSETTYLGSNTFGNDTADTHQFTGSIFVDGNSTLGNAAADVATVTAQLTASQGLTSTDAAFFNANVTLGNAAADVITSTGQLTGSEGAYFAKNVGIGATSPTSQLEIEGSSGDLVLEIDNNASNSANFQIQNGAGNARVDLVMNDGSDNTTLTMKGQRFGLNTTSPTATLTVAGAAHVTGSILPGTNNTHDLGSSTMKWANVYTGDLHLKNDRGDWTILEEQDYLCVINNATGKKYKMMLQEIDD